MDIIKPKYIIIGGYEPLINQMELYENHKTHKYGIDRAICYMKKCSEIRTNWLKLRQICV